MPSMTVTACLRSIQQPKLMSFAKLPKRRKLDFLVEESAEEPMKQDPNKTTIAEVVIAEGDMIKSDQEPETQETTPTIIPPD